MPNWRHFIKSKQEALLNLLGFLVVGVVYYVTSVSLSAALAVFITFGVIYLIGSALGRMEQKNAKIQLQKINDDLLELKNDKQKLKKTLYFPLTIEYWWNYLDIDNKSTNYKLNLRITDIGGEVIQVVEELGYNDSCPTDCPYKLEDFDKETPIYATDSVRQLVADIIKVNKGTGKVSDNSTPKEQLKLKQIEKIKNNKHQ